MSVYDPAPYNPAPVKPEPNGLAVAGFVLALIAAVLSIIPFLGFLSLPLAILGGIFGIIALVKARRIRTGLKMSIASIVLSLIAVITFSIVSVVTVSALDEAMNAPLITETTSEPAPDKADQEVTDKATTGDEAISIAQQNAIDRAQSYLDGQAFSKKGLIAQLVFEAYTDRDAKFAVNSLDVNWNEQAAKRAQSYLDGQAFSRQGLIDQLVFEGFTVKQATYGVDQTGL